MFRTAVVEVFRQILISIALKERTINRDCNFCIVRHILWIGAFCVETDIGKVCEDVLSKHPINLEPILLSSLPIESITSVLILHINRSMKRTKLEKAISSHYLRTNVLALLSSTKSTHKMSKIARINSTCSQLSNKTFPEIESSEYCTTKSTRISA